MILLICLVFYVAYFRLHDIPWEIPEPITIQDAEKITQVKIGSGLCLIG